MSQVEYVLDAPDADAFIQSFPIFLVTVDLGSRLQQAGLTGFNLVNVVVRPSDNYVALYGDVPPPRYSWMQVTGAPGTADCWLDTSFHICVSDRMKAIIDTVPLTDCLVEEI